MRQIEDGTGECTYCGRTLDATTLRLLAEMAALERTPSQRPLPSVVYYIQWADRIKIGTSDNIRQRLGKLYHDELLAVEPGDRKLESSRHSQFAEYRLPKYREWFEASPALIFHTNTLRAKHATLLDSI